MPLNLAMFAVFGIIGAVALFAFLPAIALLLACLAPVVK